MFPKNQECLGFFSHPKFQIAPFVECLKGECNLELNSNHWDASKIQNKRL